jgi:hypothetical protein
MRAPARSTCGVGVRGRHDGRLLPYSDGDLQQSDIRRSSSMEVEVSLNTREECGTARE